MGKRPGSGRSGGMRGDLATWWPGVDDRHVNNGRDDAHSASRYLSKAETGSAIADSYPGLSAR